MISISFGKWVTKSTSLFIWERVYRNGSHWTPLIMAKIRYSQKVRRNGEPIPEPVSLDDIHIPKEWLRLKDFMESPEGKNILGSVTINSVEEGDNEVSPCACCQEESEIATKYGKDLVERYGIEFLEKINSSPFEAIKFTMSGKFEEGGLVPKYRVWEDPKSKYTTEILRAINSRKLVEFRPQAPKKANFLGMGGWVLPDGQDRYEGLLITGFSLSPGADMNSYSILNVCLLMCPDDVCKYLVCGDCGFACAKTESELHWQINQNPRKAELQSHCQGITNTRHRLSGVAIID